MLLNGRTTQEIAETLTDLGRTTGLKKVCGKVNTKWNSNGVAATLRKLSIFDLLQTHPLTPLH
jgi:hypothetical protein